MASSAIKASFTVVFGGMFPAATEDVPMWPTRLFPLVPIQEQIQQPLMKPVSTSVLVERT